MPQPNPGATLASVLKFPETAPEPVPVAAKAPAAPPPALSRHFDSTRAVERLTAANGRDRQKLTRPPRQPGAMMRLLRDPDLRLLTLMVVVAVAGAVAIAAG